MVVEGDKAPDFTLKSDGGIDVSLSDFRGKNVILYFYPKDGTSGCTREAKKFRDLAEEFSKENSKENAVIIGVSRDSVESHKRFKEKHNLPFILLSDPNGEVHKMYEVLKEKTRGGKVSLKTERSTFIIDEAGVIKKIYRKVKVKGHAQTCLLDLKG